MITERITTKHEEQRIACHNLMCYFCPQKNIVEMNANGDENNPNIKRK